MLTEYLHKCHVTILNELNQSVLKFMQEIQDFWDTMPCQFVTTEYSTQWYIYIRNSASSENLQVTRL
jgi:hypothetical protein